MISNPDKVDVSAPTASNAADERHILAIAQDLIHATTHGRVKTAKHIDLTMSVRHIRHYSQLRKSWCRCSI